MQIQEAYVCPHCGGERVQIFGVQRLFSDARYDAVGCPECGAEWRVYYKVSEVGTEVVKGPDTPPEAVKVAEDVNSAPDKGEGNGSTEEIKNTEKTAKAKDAAKK